MTVLQPDIGESDPVRRETTTESPAVPVPPREPAEGMPSRRHPDELTDSSGLVRLHESIAALLASRGQWRQAYHHLRSALDLASAKGSEPIHVPEQLRREVDRLRKEHAEVQEQSLRDSLTSSYNRRYLDQRLLALPGEMDEHSAGLAVALVDLDWFKQVNDTYGHLLGDRVLQRVVELLQEGLPAGAFCARYGGEEFVLVLPDIDAPSAVAVCETTRARIERYAWHQLVVGLRVTVSIGLAHEQRIAQAVGRLPTSHEEQLLRADSLLYTAKQSGRNAVAYQEDGVAHLAGAASGRRTVVAPRVVGYY